MKIWRFHSIKLYLLLPAHHRAHTATPNQHADKDAGVIVFHEKTPRTQIVNAHNLRGVVKVATASVLRGAQR
jgi:hypothetical protein